MKSEEKASVPVFRKVLFWIATSSTSNEVKQRETRIDSQKQAGSFWITKGRRKWAESCALRILNRIEQ